MTTNNGNENEIVPGQNFNPSAPAADEVHLESHNIQPSAPKEEKKEEYIMVTLPDGRTVTAVVLGQVSSLSSDTVELQAGIRQNEGEVVTNINNESCDEGVKIKKQIPTGPTVKELIAEAKADRKKQKNEMKSLEPTEDDVNSIRAEKGQKISVRTAEQIFQQTHKPRDTLYRIPSTKPNHYNLMYGRIHCINFLYLWIIFIMIFIYFDQATIAHWCYNQYPDGFIGDDYCRESNGAGEACNADPLCRYDVYGGFPYAEPGCLTEDDCACCADDIFGAYGFLVSFWVFLGVNTLRFVVIDTIRYGCDVYQLHNAENGVIYYATYLCDNPASYATYLLCDNPVFFPDEPSQKLTDGIRDNIVLPTTMFLIMNHFIFYIPMIIFVGYIMMQQIRIGMNARRNVDTSLLIVCVVGIILLLIGFAMNCYRWRMSNIMRKQNIREYEKNEGREIDSPSHIDDEVNAFCCDCKSVKMIERKALKEANKRNLVYRWIHLFVLIWLWIVLIYSIDVYSFDGGANAEAMIPFPIFLSINTFRVLVIDFLIVIYHVYDRINYVKDTNTGRAKLMPYMDYICDHPVGIIIGYLYKDVEDALVDALKYNVTFPYEVPNWINIWLFYIPLFTVSFIQIFSVTEEDVLYLIMWTVASIGCLIGFLVTVSRMIQRPGEFC